MHRGARSYASIVLLVAAGASACSDDTAGSGGAGTGAGDPGATFGDGACWQCVEPACAESISACGSDAGCAAWVACLEACPIGANGDADAACEAACPVDGTVAAEGRDAIVACRQSGAGAACADCGGAATGSTGTGAPTCELPAVVEQTCQPAEISDDCIRCTQEECCDSYREVFSSGPTGDLADCWLACPNDDGDCSYQCYLDHPDGVQGFGNFRACNEINCEVPGLCPSPHETPCLLCQRAECMCELAACYADTQCHTAQECLLSCAENDTECGVACRNAYPDGAAKFEVLGTCTSQNCVQVCF